MFVLTPQVDSMKTQVTVCSDGSEVRQTEIDDLKRKVQDLTLELQLLETQVTYAKKMYTMKFAVFFCCTETLETESENYRFKMAALSLYSLAYRICQWRGTRWK